MSEIYEKLLLIIKECLKETKTVKIHLNKMLFEVFCSSSLSNALDNVDLIIILLQSLELLIKPEIRR